MNNNLIPKDLSRRKDHLELSSKGGQSRSPSKVFSSRINGMLNSNKYSIEQKYMLTLLKDKKIGDLIIELISRNLEEIENPTRRDKVIEQLSKFIPNQTLNVDVTGNSFDVEEYQYFKEAVFEICFDKIELILAKMDELKENGKR